MLLKRILIVLLLCATACADELLTDDPSAADVVAYELESSYSDQGPEYNPPFDELSEDFTPTPDTKDEVTHTAVPYTYEATNRQSIHKPAETKFEEYINRIAKKIMIVSGRDLASFSFIVSDSRVPELIYEPEHQAIVISQGVFEQLSDEAELAAILTLSLAKYDGILDQDRETVDFMSRAGYDPKAMLELVEEYFHAANRGQNHWLSQIYTAPPTAGTITSNRVLIEKIPQGLQRGVETYQEQLKG